MLLLTACVERVYSVRTNATAVLRTHRSVAVLPFDVRIERPWLSRFTYADLGTTEAEFKRQQKAEISELAYSLQTELLAQLQRRRGTVQYLSAAETNQRLTAAGIPPDSIAYRSTEELQRVLAVDAVLAGDTRVVQPLPGPLVALLFFAPPTTYDDIEPNRLISRLALYDGRSGQLAWRFDHEQIGNARVVPRALARDLVKRAASSWPYRPQ
jgi:hypothetical protein